MKRDLFELLLGIGVLAVGLVIVLFTFSFAYGIVTNPGGFVQDQIPEEQPVAGPTASFDWISNGLSVQFEDTTVQGDAAITSWDWDFGDGQRSTLQSPAHTYADNSSYQASLIVVDANDKRSSAVSQVTTVVTQTRSGRSVTNPAEGLSLNLDFGNLLRPMAVVLLTIGVLFVMGSIGGRIMLAGWNVLKPKPETIHVRVKPKHLTQALEPDMQAFANPPPPRA